MGACCSCAPGIDWKTAGTSPRLGGWLLRPGGVMVKARGTRAVGDTRPLHLPQTVFPCPPSSSHLPVVVWRSPACLLTAPAAAGGASGGGGAEAWGADAGGGAGAEGTDLAEEGRGARREGGGRLGGRLMPKGLEEAIDDQSPNLLRRSFSG